MMLRRKDLYLVLMIGLITQPVSACDQHGAMGFGPFSGFHPLMQKRASLEKSRPLIIRHDHITQSKVGEPDYLIFSYRVPFDYDNVRVKLSSNNNIVIENSSIDVEGPSGVFTINYKSVNPGNHNISVSIEATHNERPFRKLQGITVVANAS